MLPKSRRLTTRQFNSVMEKGRVYHSPLFVLRSLSVGGRRDTVSGRSTGSKSDVPTKIAVVASTKVAKKATERNGLRRKVYEVIGTVYPNVRGDHLVIIFAKNPVITANTEQLDSGVNEIFVKAGLLG